MTFERRLNQELAPVDLDHCRPSAASVPMPVAVRTPPSPARKGPLWHQLHRELPGKHQTLRLRIGTYVRRNHPGDAAGRDEFANANTGPCRIIRDDREPAAPRSTRAAITRCGEPTPMKPPIITVA
jgi:hypothetical protein